MALTRTNISSGSPWETTFGYSRAVRAGDQVFVGGTVGRNPDGSAAPGPYAQARRALEIIGTALTEAGASLDDVVRTVGGKPVTGEDLRPAAGVVPAEAPGRSPRSAAL